MTRTLSIKTGDSPSSAEQPAEDTSSAAPSAGTEMILRQALATATSVSATYNHGTVLLHPYALYREHDALFLEAVTVLRDGKPPKEIKIGTYRLTGLKDIAGTTTGFMPRAEWRPAEDRPGKQIIATAA